MRKKPEIKPKVAVLMLSWLRFEILLETLKDLPLTCSEPLHLILRVQGSERLSEDNVKEVHEAASGFSTTDIYFTPYNVGSAAARLDLTHRGAKAGYKYLLFTDDDIRFPKDGIDKQVEILDKHSNVGAAALRPDNKRFLRVVSGDYVTALDRRMLTGLFYKVFCVGSASLMFRSILYTKHLAAPDPAYYIGTWDFDFVLQIWQSRYAVVELPSYAIRNKKGGCEEYRRTRYGTKREYLKHNRKISLEKWGFDITVLPTRMLNGTTKMPFIGRR